MYVKFALCRGHCLHHHLSCHACAVGLQCGIVSHEFSTWMGDCLQAGIPSWYVTSQLGQLSLASVRGCYIE